MGSGEGEFLQYHVGHGAGKRTLVLVSALAVGLGYPLGTVGMCVPRGLQAVEVGWGQAQKVPLPAWLCRPSPCWEECAERKERSFFFKEASFLLH